MATQILILGMHRSGTTLLADIIGKHPDVKHIFNEAVLLDQKKEDLLNATSLPDHELIQKHGSLERASNVIRKDLTIDFDLSQSTWGAKMSYPGPIILQEWQASSLKYANRWLDYFDHQARILLVIRHPYDVYLSAHARWAKHDKHIANYGEVTLDNICRDWSYALDLLLPNLQHNPRVNIVLYETLLSQPIDTIRELFNHINVNSDANKIIQLLKSDIIFFGKIDPARAFNYRQRHVDHFISHSTLKLLEPHFERFGYHHD